MDEFQQGGLLRIFIDEVDRRGLQPMYTAVVEFLRSKHIAGATVFRGIEGYGSHGEIHIAKLFSWLPNLPILIEVVDERQKLDGILPELHDIVGEGLITMEAVEYLRLSPPPKHHKAVQPAV